jgi:hypothetical protein
MGREERFRTAISGMEPRRIAVVMLLPHSEPRRTTHYVMAWLLFVSTNENHRYVANGQLLLETQIGDLGSWRGTSSSSRARQY